MKRFTAILLAAVLTLSATTVFANPSITGNEMSAVTTGSVDLSSLGDNETTPMEATKAIGEAVGIDAVCEGFNLDLNGTESAEITVASTAFKEGETYTIVIVDQDGNVIEEHKVTATKNDKGQVIVSFTAEHSGTVIIGNETENYKGVAKNS